MQPAATPEWSPDNRSFTLNELRFVAVPDPPSDPALKPGENCFAFHKGRPLVEEYLDFLRCAPLERPRNLIELGLFEGGSVPFWFELLRPDKHVGIDIQDGEDSPYFRAYLEGRNLADRIATFWRTNQADFRRLGEICEGAFGSEPLDLVIDDASHFYAETRASFEILFPRLRSGGLYIIEDWAWFHWRGIERGWREKRPLTHLIHEITEAVGSSRSVIESAVIRGGFAAVRRGSGALKPGRFDLSDYIYRHPR